MYTLEPPRRGGSNEYPQSMFWSKNKKNRYILCYTLVGFEGVHIVWYVKYSVSSFQLKSALTLDKSCEGIDCLNEDIFVSCIDKTGKEIRIIDMEGNLKRKIVLDDEDVDIRPFYVTVSCCSTIQLFQSRFLDWESPFPGQRLHYHYRMVC